MSNDSGHKATSLRRGAASRAGTQYLVDSLAWIAALILAQVLRYDLQLDRINIPSLAVLCLAAVVAQFVAGWLVHLYRGRHPQASFAEVRALVAAVLLTALVVGSPVIVAGTLWEIPRSNVLIAAPIAFVVMGASRYLQRSMQERLVRPSAEAEPAIVYGAGYLGSTMIRRMRTDVASPYFPVALIDDNPGRRNVWLDGVRVRGTGSDLERIAEETGAKVVIVTIAKADAGLLREISDAAIAAGLRMKVLPLLEEVLEGKSRLRDLRDVSIVDLVGRHPVDTEVGAIAGYLEGKRVLITGAGGSIGSELCRQISKFAPSELIMLDHDETGLQSTQMSIRGHGLLNNREVVLANIRDKAAVKRIFEDRKPEVVFHAAALKHLPMLEQYPWEAWKTNVLGTLNVLEAARDTRVMTFVNISTDKAANPISVLGHSKRMSEELTAWAARDTGGRYLSVRFGNVLNSRGSMIPTFTTLIENGGPLTITHPDATRYFMTIPEACQLVVQAGGIGEPGAVLVLDMGEPVRILDVAQRMIDMSGRDIAITYTGLRPGEKLHEELLGPKESRTATSHDRITATRVPALNPSQLTEAEWERRCRIVQGQTSGDATITRLPV